MTITERAPHYNALAAELAARRPDDSIDFTVVEARMMKRFRLSRRDMAALCDHWDK